MARRILTVLLLVLAAACSRSPEQGYRDAGEALSREMLSTLQRVHTRDDLLSAQATLERLYIDYAELILACKQDLGEVEDKTIPSSALSDALRTELIRVYEIDGGRSIVEEAQQEALRYLAKNDVS